MADQYGKNPWDAKPKKNALNASGAVTPATSSGSERPWEVRQPTPALTPPVAAPAPVVEAPPVLADVNPQETAARRQRYLARLRMGLMSTIKTKQQGATLGAPSLALPTLKAGF
jgi:type IV secretory pathway VirB10-like protein